MIVIDDNEEKRFSSGFRVRKRTVKCSRIYIEKQVFIQCESAEYYKKREIGVKKREKSKILLIYFFFTFFITGVTF